jgi:hypothetical protein
MAIHTIARVARLVDNINSIAPGIIQLRTSRTATGYDTGATDDRLAASANREGKNYITGTDRWRQLVFGIVRGTVVTKGKNTVKITDASEHTRCHSGARTSTHRRGTTEPAGRATEGTIHVLTSDLERLHFNIFLQRKL